MGRLSSKFSTEFLVGAAVAGVALAYALYPMYSDYFAGPKVAERLRKMTEEDVSKFDGEGPKSCFVAVNGKIYNVTPKKDKFVSSNLGGKALSDSDLKAVGLSAEAVASQFMQIGTILVLKDFTKEELKKFDGSNGQPVYIGAKGKVYEVDPNFYGKGAPYEVFGGRDATRALAKMSFEEEDLNNNSVEGLNWSERQALEDWIMKFETKYTCVGYIK